MSHGRSRFAVRWARERALPMGTERAAFPVWVSPSLDGLEARLRSAFVARSRPAYAARRQLADPLRLEAHRSTHTHLYLIEFDLALRDWRGTRPGGRGSGSYDHGSGRLHLEPCFRVTPSMHKGDYPARIEYRTPEGRSRWLNTSICHLADAFACIARCAGQTLNVEIAGSGALWLES